MQRWKEIVRSYAAAAAAAAAMPTPVIVKSII
jgi:hypothetical protein